MFRELAGLAMGAAEWQLLRARFLVHDKKVVVVLAHDNRKLDYYALYYLRDFMGRKYADQAVILTDEEAARKMACKMKKEGLLPDSARICLYPEERIRRLYQYYSFYKFSDKIVFTYTDSPGDNQLGKALRETAVDERDAVCLGFYHLRGIPEREGAGGRAYV